MAPTMTHTVSGASVRLDLGLLTRMTSNIPKIIYAVKWRPGKRFAWRHWGGHFSESYREIKRLADKWWGPDGYDYEYEVFQYFTLEGE